MKIDLEFVTNQLLLKVYMATVADITKSFHFIIFFTKKMSHEVTF